MTPNEADKIIAEFMEVWCDNPECAEEKICRCGTYTKFNYSQSLDELVPVWERLDICMKIEWLRYHGVIFYLEKPNEIEVHHTCSVTSEITEAAAIATAKAIRELSSE